MKIDEKKREYTKFLKDLQTNLEYTLTLSHPIKLTVKKIISKELHCQIVWLRLLF
ncbi:hypothetical protein CLV81_1712 [Flagellimonas meridianipacifica]|uniref:Uncharacterized protein n=1 Tax=Flagellimonas meridianipacifica TaxID=1080225 RepID=A0A2T0MJE5_9FLAO|nr:hypothetical protein CLV81_1712 [Allomuricauda pacifica]